jgi:3',5'-cyclic AMP phosphodiesterase CpdA
MGAGTVTIKRAAFIASILVLIAFDLSAKQEQQVQQKLGSLKQLPAKFSFVVLGDTRTGDDVYGQIIAMAAARIPALIVNTGDQIAQPGNRGQWANFWEMSKPVTMPYFLTVGNHDASAGAAGSEEVYRDEVDLPGNERYYSFAAGNAFFVVLDSYLAGEENRIAGEQLRWLERTLASADQKHRFVFLHHPLYPDQGKGKHAGRSMDRYPEDRDQLHKLFKKYHVTAVFQGHEHVYLRKVVDGVLYITAGGGGAPLYAKDEDGGFHHYVYVTVEGDRVAGEVVDISGKVRDRFVTGTGE